MPREGFPVSKPALERQQDILGKAVTDAELPVPCFFCIEFEFLVQSEWAEIKYPGLTL